MISITGTGLSEVNCTIWFILYTQLSLTKITPLSTGLYHSKQAFNLPQVTDLVSMYRRGPSSRRRMLQSDACRPVALHKVDRRRVARFAVSVVVSDGEDDREHPDQGRPVSAGEVDWECGGEAGPDDDEGAVEEAEGVDVDAVRAHAPAGWGEGLASDALEEDAAWLGVSLIFEVELWVLLSWY